MADDASNRDRQKLMPSLVPPPLGPEDLTAKLAGNLGDEAAVLETLIATLGRGEDAAELFVQFHDAAARNARVEAVAQAYERATRDHRLRKLGREHQAQLTLQAARFFADIARDAKAAVTFAERALAAAPGADEPLAIAERVLAGSADSARAAELYRVAASLRSGAAEQGAVWRRAVALFDAMPGAGEHAIAARERIVKLDPHDSATRAELARQYGVQGRHRDLARMIEDVLTREPGPPPEDEARMRSRLVLLYRDTLREPQRALPHLERLLAANPVDESTLEAAETLMESRMLAQRLAPLLTGAYERLRRPHDELAVLVRELKFARPPRLGEVQRRLALLRLEVLEDVEGALELLGPLVAAQPGDDVTRRRFLEISARAEKSAEAARLLARALQHTKDESARARIGYDLGTLQLVLGDAAAAQAAFEQVAKSGGDEDAVLASARKLVELLGPSGDPKKVARALQVVVRLEPDAARRHPAARRLAELADQYELGAFYAISAWRGLLDSSEANEALTRLESLGDKAHDEGLLAEVLELKAARTPDKAEARVLAFRSAELRSKSQPPAVALQSFRKFVESHGATREAYERMATLLEQTRQYDELASVLEAQARLVEPAERAVVFARLAEVRERSKDAPGALEALRRSLEIDPNEPATRAALERLARKGAVRVEAGELLEPIYRREGRHAELVELLEIRAARMVDPAQQLACLFDAAEIVETELQDPERGIELCRAALKLAKTAARARLPEWLERLGRFSAAAGRSERLAEIVLEVLGEGDQLEPELLDLARVAAEALLAAGDLERAQSLFERAQAEDPSSPEILSRLDELARRQGATPEQRIERFRRALPQAASPERWRRLMHALAAIQRLDLGSLDAAVATLREIREQSPDDWESHVALVDALQAQNDVDSLDAELERALASFTGPERQLVLVKMIERLDARGEEERALELCRSLLEQEGLEAAALDIAERLFEKAGDVESARRVLDRRVAVTTEPIERADALERLGNFLLDQLGESNAAVEAWRTAARLCLDRPDEVGRARRLYERVLDAAAGDPEANERLVELYAAAGDWAKVPEVYAACVRNESSDARRVDVLLTLAPRAAQAGAADEFIALADEELWRLGRETPGLGRKLIAAKAHVLAAVPSRHRDASHTFRTLVDSYGDPEDVREFSELVDRTSDEDVRRESLRWLFEWRAGHASDPLPVLFEWAEAEEARLRAPEGAVAVYERVTTREPKNRRALEAIARLALEGGRVERALEALEGLRSSKLGGERVDLDLRMASLALEHLGRPAAALPYVARALEGSGLAEPVMLLARRLLADPEARLAAAELLEGAATAAGPSEAKRMTQLLLEATEPSPELRSMRERWWDKRLELAGADDREALGVALEAAAELPDVDAHWARAEQLAKRAGDLAAVGAAYQRALARQLDVEAAERLGARAADFFEQVLGEPSGAVAALQRVLALSPGARWALDRVKITLTLQRRYEELLELYDRVLGAQEQSTDQAELLDEAVVVARDLANEPSVAIGYLERLYELRPADARIESSLERLYERQGETRKLIELYARRAEGATEAEQLEMRARMAALWVELGEPRQALGMIEPMLQSRRETALGLLEKILRLASAPEEESIDLLRAAQRRASRLLSAEYARAGRQADVVRVAELELDLLDDPAEKVGRLRQIVSLRLDDLKDPAGAFDSVCNLVRLDPRSSAHRVQAAELATRLGAEERLAEVLIHAAEEADAPRAQLLVDAGQLYAGRLADPDRAIELYTAALEHAAEQPEGAREAGNLLEQLLLVQGRPAERCSVLERLAEFADAVQDRRRVLAESARVAFQELHDADRAARNWRLVLEREPQHPAALDGLVQALRAANRPRQLVEALEARASATSDAQAVRRDFVRIAHLYADEIGDRESAAAVWRRIRERFGPDSQSFDALTRLYEQLERWDDLVQLLHEEARAEKLPERRRQLFARLGRLHAERTGDHVAAIHGFSQAEDYAQAIGLAEQVQSDERVGKSVLRALLKVATDAWRAGDRSGDSAPARAAHWSLRTLAEQHAAEGQPPRALELLIGGARLPFPRQQQRELRRDAARLAVERVSDPQRAIDILRQLFAEDVADEVAQSIVGEYDRLLAEAGLNAERAELSEARARVAPADQAEQLWTRSAELWESGALDAERAIAAWQRAAEHGSERALEALARLHRAAGDVRKAAEALDALLERASPETRAERAVRAAEAYLDLDEQAIARVRLELALAEGADPPAIRARLVEVYRAEAAWRPLAELLEAEAREEWDAARQADLFREAAKLYSEQLADPASAITALEGARGAAPERHELGAELADLLAAVGRHAEAITILEQRIAAYDSRRPKERALVHQKLARLLIGAGRPADAMSALEQAAQIDPTRTDILFELARLAELQGKLPEAEQTYRALLLAARRPSGADDETPTVAEVYLGLGEVARRRGDVRGADDFVESAFEAAGGDAREARGLERALRSLGRNELLVRAFERRLERARDPAEAADALGELVALERAKPQADAERMARVRSRAEELRGLLADQNAGARAFRSLHRVFGWLEDDATAAALAERWVKALDPAAAEPEELYELAGVCLASPERADQGARLLERALERQPNPARALELLRPAVEREPPSEGATRLFEKTCRSKGREELRAWALSRLAALPTATAADVRAGVDHAVAAGNPALADAILKGAASRRFAASDRAWMLARRATLAESSGQLREAVELCERAAEVAPDPNQAAEFLRRAASLALDRAGDPARAFALLSRLIERTPDDPSLWDEALRASAQSTDRRLLAGLVEQHAPRVTSADLKHRLLLAHAKHLIGEGGTERALELLKQVTDADPSSQDAADLRVELLERAGRTDELIVALRRRIDAASEDVEQKVRLCLHLGGLLEREQRASDALEVYREACAISSRNIEALRAVVRLGESHGLDADELASALTELVALEAGEAAAQAALRLSRIRTEQGDEAAAERALLEGFARAPADAEIVHELSRRFTEAAQWQKLAELLGRALDARPENRGLTLRASEACRKAARYDRALELLDALGEQADAALVYERFVVLQAARRREEALAALEDAARLEPRYVEELERELEASLAELDPSQLEPRALGLAALVEQSGAGDRARDLLRRFSQTSPPPRGLLEKLAELERSAGSWMEAMSTYRRLLQLDLGDKLETTALALADACERAGRAADARADLERAVERAPKSTRLRERLRRLYDKIGARDQLARTYLREASEHADPLVRVGALVNAGVLMLETGNLGQAIGALERALEQEPAHIEAALLLAQAHESSGERQRALEVLLGAVGRHDKKRSKDVARLHARIGELHLRADDLVEALEALEKAFELDRTDAGAALLLGLLAVDLDRHRTAQQALQAVTAARPGITDAAHASSAEARSVAYYHLGRIARLAGDEPRARLMVTKAMRENPENRQARSFLDELGADA